MIEAIAMNELTNIVPDKDIEQRILIIQGQKVILDVDLAELYGVSTKRLNEQIKRNKERFPSDFMFQLISADKKEVVANCDHLSNLKYSHNNPYAFTEHGVIMAASVLNTPYAIEVSVVVVRTFIKLRQILAIHKDIQHKLEELEQKFDIHDDTIKTLIATLQELMKPPEYSKANPIGFAPWPVKEFEQAVLI